MHENIVTGITTLDPLHFLETDELEIFTLCTTNLHWKSLRGLFGPSGPGGKLQ